MSIINLADRLERRRRAAEAILLDIESEFKEARDAIMARALRRLAKADPSMTLRPTIDGLCHAWCDAALSCRQDDAKASGASCTGPASTV
jgi:hypothetical protein